MTWLILERYLLYIAGGIQITIEISNNSIVVKMKEGNKKIFTGKYKCTRV